jgi:hypothetical protein
LCWCCVPGVCVGVDGVGVGYCVVGGGCVVEDVMLLVLVLLVVSVLVLMGLVMVAGDVFGDDGLCCLRCW